VDRESAITRIKLVTREAPNRIGESPNRIDKSANHPMESPNRESFKSQVSGYQSLYFDPSSAVPSKVV
jgi:hypothetical protein